MTATVTAPSNGKPTTDRVERTRTAMARARTEAEAAVRDEFEGLIDIAWKYQNAASTALLAVSRAEGITDHDRQETIIDIMGSYDSALRFLRLATSCLTRTDEVPL